MNNKWLNKCGNKNLIVFFNGWGMDERIVSHLNCSNYDVLVFYDYGNYDIEDIDFSLYENKNLIAWSMGVYACNYFYDKFKDFNGFTAVNGTQKPIDDNYGIPVMIYNLTVDNFNELSCSKFMKKISTDVDLKQYSTRSTDELKRELISLQNLKIENFLKFDKAIISKKDRIIPYQNQKNYWEKEGVKIFENDGAHYIFNQFNSWENFL